MIPTRPDMSFVLRVLNDLMRLLNAPGAYLILAKSLKELVLIEKEDARAEQLSTLAIDGAERLYINVAFWNKQVRSQHDAKFVLLHELMHHILGDTAILRKRAQDKQIVIDDLEGIATDARINALIHGMIPFGDTNEGTSILYRMYKPKGGVQALLRPNSSLPTTDELYNLYQYLYFDPGVRGYEDILNALKVILAQKIKKTKIQLIGSHGAGGGKGEKEKGEGGKGAGEELKEMPKEIKDALIGELMDGASQNAGYGGNAFSYFVQLLKNQRSIDRRLLRNYSTTHKINKIRSMFQEKKRSRKPVPIYPTKRDLLKMAVTGTPPVMWAAPKTRNKTTEFGVAIYLDLSGSVHDHLPKIVRMIVSMKKEVQVIYGFSNEVHEHSLNQLRRGELKTTGGTDFDCIAEHCLEEGFKRCVVITDGWASMNAKNSREMSDQLEKAALILFGTGDNKDNWFSQQYDTFHLDEVVG